MTNNIVIAENKKGKIKVVFSSAKTGTEAKKMADDQGDKFISLIPIRSNIMLDSCVADEGYRIAIESFLAALYEVGRKHGASQLREELTNTASAFMEHRFRKMGL